MTELASLRISEFLEQTADRTPAPGGGAVAGLTGAAAGALAGMVIAYSISKKTGEEERARLEAVRLRLHRCDQIFRALMTRDAEVYEALAAASRRLKEDAAEAPTHQRCVLDAIAVPMEMAGLCADLLDTLHDVLPITNPYLRSDLGIAACLANATAVSARYTVMINLGELADRDMADRIQRQIDQLVGRCREVSDAVTERVQSNL